MVGDLEPTSGDRLLLPAWTARIVPSSSE
jgi:hypothetical protein